MTLTEQIRMHPFCGQDGFTSGNPGTVESYRPSSFYQNHLVRMAGFLPRQEEWGSRKRRFSFSNNRHPPGLTCGGLRHSSLGTVPKSSTLPLSAEVGTWPMPDHSLYPRIILWDWYVDKDTGVLRVFLRYKMWAYTICIFLMKETSRP